MKLDNKLRSIYSWNINRASGKNSRVCSLSVCLHPRPLPSSGRNLISKGLTRKKDQVHCQRVKSKLVSGWKPAALIITGEIGTRQMGRAPISASLRMSPDRGRWWASYKFNRKSWNGRAKGLKQAPHTSCRLGNCSCVQEGPERAPQNVDAVALEPPTEPET